MSSREMGLWGPLTLCDVTAAQIEVHVDLWRCIVSLSVRDVHVAVSVRPGSGVGPTLEEVEALLVSCEKQLARRKLQLAQRLLLRPTDSRGPGLLRPPWLMSWALGLLGRFSVSLDGMEVVLQVAPQEVRSAGSCYRLHLGRLRLGKSSARRIDLSIGVRLSLTPPTVSPSSSFPSCVSGVTGPIPARRGGGWRPGDPPGQLGL